MSSPSSSRNPKKNRRSLFTLVQERLPAVPRCIVTTVFGFVRASGHYHPHRENDALLLREQILSVLATNPSYGYRRIALALHVGKKRIRRMMQLFGIKRYKRKARWRKRRDEQRVSAPFLNHIKSQCPVVPNHTWVGDCTYLPFKKQFLYLATFMDLYTREIVGWHLAIRHTKELVMEAFLDGLVTQHLRKPTCVHSDQGVEYTNEAYITLLQSFGITVSMSKKSSPWENGYQESFYNNFKTDLGLECDRFSDIGQFAEAIAHTIHTYNTTRIHITLRMPPAAFHRLHSP